MLVHLPREDGYRHGHSIKNGPALAGYGAITMKNALAATMSTLPQQPKRSVTWDREKNDPLTLHSKSRPEYRCSSPILTRRGSAAPTRTRMVFYGSTFRRAPTCPDGTPMTSKQSLGPTTDAGANGPSAGSPR